MLSARCELSGGARAISVIRPPLLFGRGDPALLPELIPKSAVTIVGSRRPSSYGRELATKLGREVAAAGLTVISGMAMGIDACAHAGRTGGGRSDRRCSRQRGGRPLPAAQRAALRGDRRQGRW